MPFVLRKQFPRGRGERYVVIAPGFEDRPLPGAASFDPDVRRATRFPTREGAEGWRAVLDGPGGRVVLVEV